MGVERKFNDLKKRSHSRSNIRRLRALASSLKQGGRTIDDPYTLAYVYGTRCLRMRTVYNNSTVVDMDARTGVEWGIGYGGKTGLGSCFNPQALERVLLDTVLLRA